MNIYYEWGASGADTASRRGDVCIVIDIFRASSTIVTALATGFIAVKPVASLANKPGHYLTAGEVDGHKMAASDFGNSPTEIKAYGKKGNKLLIKTTNGTKCVENITNPTAIVLIGCILNAKSVAEAAYVLSCKMNKDISFVLAGRHGEYCEDDEAAGKFIADLIQANAKSEQLIAQHYMKTKDILLNSVAAQQLLDKGYAEDIKFCTQLDYYAIVPTYNIQSQEINPLILTEEVNI